MIDNSSVIDQLISELNSSPAAADLLIGLVGQQLTEHPSWATVRGGLRDAGDHVRFRVLSDGNPVVNDESGVRADLSNKSLFDTLNIQGGSTSIQSDNKRQVNINISAGADCLFDYLVSTCFATLAGFTEGKTYTSLSGCTFQGYSTVQGAIGQLTVFSGSKTFFICGGTYNEDVVCPNTSGTDHFEIVGAGQGRTVIRAVTTNGETWTYNPNGAFLIRNLTLQGNGTGLCCNPGADLRDVTLAPESGGTGVSFGGSNQYQNIRIAGSGASIGANIGGASDVFVDGMEITGCTTGILIGASNLSMRIINVSVTGATTGMNVGYTQESVFAHMLFRTCTTGVKFNSTSAKRSLFTHFTFRSCPTGMDMTNTNLLTSEISYCAFIGAAGYKGINATSSGGSHAAGCQITHLNFEGYTSGNEIFGTSGFAASTKVYHNISDAGTLADFGSPYGHSPGTGVVAHAILDGGAAHTDTVAQTVSRGSLVYGNSTPKWDELVVGAANKVLHSDGTDVSWQSLVTADMPANGLIRTITLIIDGGGSAITTGVKGDLEVPFGCTITQATLLADQSGSIVIDIWKDTYANYPPTVADTITASAKPTLSSATKSQDSTLTGWTTSVTAGDTLRFNVDSITTCTRVTLSLKVTAT